MPPTCEAKAFLPSKPETPPEKSHSRQARGNGNPDSPTKDQQAEPAPRKQNSTPSSSRLHARVQERLDARKKSMDVKGQRKSTSNTRKERGAEGPSSLRGLHKNPTATGTAPEVGTQAGRRLTPAGHCPRAVAGAARPARKRRARKLRRNTGDRVCRTKRHL